MKRISLTCVSWLIVMLAIPFCQSQLPQLSQLVSPGFSSDGDTLFQPPEGEILDADASTPKYIAAAWYAGWHGSSYPPQSISWSKYTQVTYAFA